MPDRFLLRFYISAGAVPDIQGSIYIQHDLQGSGGSTLMAHFQAHHIKMTLEVPWDSGPFRHNLRTDAPKAVHQAALLELSAAAIARPIFTLFHPDKCRLDFHESTALALQSCCQHVPRQILHRRSRLVVKFTIHHNMNVMPIDAHSQFISLRSQLLFKRAKQSSRSFGHFGHVPRHLELKFGGWQLVSARVPHS